jgi:hypothetical protein
MDAPSRRVWAAVAAVVLLAAVVSVLAGHGPKAQGEVPSDAKGQWRITAQQRAAGPRFDMRTLAPADRAWIEDAIAGARPEARPLIEEVDGLVTFVGGHGPLFLGLTIPDSRGTTIQLNLDYLDYNRKEDRRQTVLHELGHVIDYALLSDRQDAGFDAAIPRTGQCVSSGDGIAIGACALPRERFADTFAKWALRGAVSITGGGYGIPMPPSLETWGAPLTALGAQLRQR